MEWIKTNNNPKDDECPKHSGNYDYSSVRVLVAYIDECGYKQYGIGYTDWDGSNFYWNVDKWLRPYKQIIAYSYITELTKEQWNG